MAAWLALFLLTCCSHAAAIQFTLEKDECFTFHNELTGDVIHGSFVIVNSNSWGDWEEVGLDLTVGEATRILFYCIWYCRSMSFQRAPCLDVSAYISDKLSWVVGNNDTWCTCPFYEA